MSEAVAWWIAAASAVMLLATLIAVPIVLARIPVDYFKARRRAKRQRHHPAIAAVLRVCKSVLGLMLVAAGLFMLVLPGQGLITILVGLMLLEFPGKYRLERWIVGRRPVFSFINWVRRLSGQPPLVRE
jgi:ABC-type xylose transport system permease subunit